MQQHFSGFVYSITYLIDIWNFLLTVHAFCKGPDSAGQIFIFASAPPGKPLSLLSEEDNRRVHKHGESRLYSILLHFYTFCICWFLPFSTPVELLIIPPVFCNLQELKLRLFGIKIHIGKIIISLANLKGQCVTYGYAASYNPLKIAM